MNHSTNPFCRLLRPDHGQSVEDKWAGNQQRRSLHFPDPSKVMWQSTRLSSCDIGLSGHQAPSSSSSLNLKRTGSGKPSNGHPFAHGEPGVAGVMSGTERSAKVWDDGAWFWYLGVEFGCVEPAMFSQNEGLPQEAGRSAHPRLRE